MSCVRKRKSCITIIRNPPCLGGFLISKEFKLLSTTFWNIRTSSVENFHFAKLLVGYSHDAQIGWVAKNTMCA